MIKPEDVDRHIDELQNSSNLEENDDYAMLMQRRRYLEQKMYDSKYLKKNLQFLYTQLDKTRNYQEFVDILMNHRDLLRKVFTLQGQMKSESRLIQKFDVEINWHKYGIDIMEYIMNNEQLVALYDDGLL